MSKTPPSKAEELKALTEKWYAVLKKEGFVDAEYNEKDLKFYSMAICDRGYDNEAWVNGKTDYYRMAEHFLHEHKFSSTTHKYMWSMHSNGVGVRDISAKLKSLSIQKNKNLVSKILRGLTAEMFKRYGVSAHGARD